MIKRTPLYKDPHWNELGETPSSLKDGKRSSRACTCHMFRALGVQGLGVKPLWFRVQGSGFKV